MVTCVCGKMTDWATADVCGGKQKGWLPVVGENNRFGDYRCVGNTTDQGL